MTSSMAEPALVEVRLPLGPVAALVADVAGREALHAAAYERLSTDEGEHALLVALDGADGISAVGIVFGEDHCVRVSGRSPTAVRQRLCAVALGLPPLRPRRFHYEPPPGWQLRRHGAATLWLAPGFPDEAGAIAVYPAEPAAGDAQSLALRLAGDRRRVATIGFTCARGLEGVVMQLDGERALEIVALRDDRFGYVVCLETASAWCAQHRRALEGIVESIEPLPRPRPPPPLLHSLR